MKSSLSKEQINVFFKAQWKPISLGCVIVVMMLVTLLIPGNSKKSLTTTPRNSGNKSDSTGNTDSAKKSSNPLDFLFGTEKKKQTISTQKVETSVVKPPPDVINAKTSQSTITKVLQNGTKEVEKVTGNEIINTIQGTINPNSSIAQDVNSNTKTDDISVAFLNPDGTIFNYIPPGTPPDEVRWARYTNTNDKYAINYPFNWQFVYSFNNGHEGVALYPPGVDPNDASSPFIGFGMANAFHLPADNNSLGAYITPLLADGVSGKLYTNGAMGDSYVAAIFPYTGRYFGLGSKKSDTTFIYVYYYMLHSLTFNIE